MQNMTAAVLLSLSILFMTGLIKEIHDAHRSPAITLFYRNTVFIVDRGDLIDSSAVLFFHERLCRQPGLDYLHRHESAYDLGAEAQDIRIGMLPCK